MKSAELKGYSISDITENVDCKRPHTDSFSFSNDFVFQVVYWCTHRCKTIQLFHNCECNNKQTHDDIVYLWCVLSFTKLFCASDFQTFQMNKQNFVHCFDYLLFWSSNLLFDFYCSIEKCNYLMRDMLSLNIIINRNFVPRKCNFPPSWK